MVGALNTHMGGPTRNKIPDDDMVNAMLNLLSYWTTLSHSRNSHTHVFVHDNSDEHTHAKRGLNIDTDINMYAHSELTY